MKKIIILVTFSVFGLVNAQNHPRITEVSKRNVNQESRINKGLSDGSLNSNQANRLNKEETKISTQEQKYITNNGGYLTKGETRQLNKEENSVNRQINRTERRNKLIK